MASAYVSVKAFADMHGVEERTVRNWIKQDPPLPSRPGKHGREVHLKRGNAWRLEFELKRQTAERSPTERAAKQRREEIQVEMAEIELREKKEELMLTHVHRARVEKISSHLAGVIKGQLPRYANDVQVAESAVQSRELLKRIEEDLLDALQRTVESIDEDPDPDDVEHGNAGAAGVGAAAA